MEKVRVELGDRSYDILIGSGTLAGVGESVAKFGFSRSVAVISNPTVFALYGGQVRASLEAAGLDCFEILIPDGEEYKDFFWAYHILTGLLRKRLDRNSCIAALGGGVIGDITGFAASLYMRGINFVQIPTTLLAQVDSSVGGKTGVNHSLGKNMIGAFYQPRLVRIDTSVLDTLPERQLLCGIAEIIKYGIIWDEELFTFLEMNRDAVLGRDEAALAHIVRRSCEIKAEVVSHDEREAGLRAILNFGHTLGHSVETETGYSRYLHGEAVAMGMQAAAKLSAALGFLGGEEVERISSLLNAYGLPAGLPPDLDAERLAAHMKIDKKTVGGAVTFILPEKIGKVRIHKNIDMDAVRKILR